jgi:hypothetical protein
VRATLGAFVALAAVGAVIYFSFISPSWQSDTGTSYSYSSDCVNSSKTLKKLPLTADMKAVGDPVLTVGWGKEIATFAFFSDASNKAVKQYLANIVKSHSSLRGHIEAHDFVVARYLHPVTPAMRNAFGQCIYAIYNNRWAGWTGFDTQKISRPFRSGT